MRAPTLSSTVLLIGAFEMKTQTRNTANLFLAVNHLLVLRKPPFWCKCVRMRERFLWHKDILVNDKFVMKLFHANDKRININCVRQVNRIPFSIYRVNGKMIQKWKKRMVFTFLKRNSQGTKIRLWFYAPRRSQTAVLSGKSQGRRPCGSLEVRKISP